MNKNRPALARLKSLYQDMLMRSPRTSVLSKLKCKMQQMDQLNSTDYPVDSYRWKYENKMYYKFHTTAISSAIPISNSNTYTHNQTISAHYQ